MKWKTPLLFLTLPLLLATTAQTQALFTLNGADIKISAGATLRVRGPILNQGDGLMNIDGELHAQNWIVNDGPSEFSTGNGVVIFFSAESAHIAGAQPSNFPNIAVAKSAGNLVLSQDVSLEGNLVLLGGGLDLNGHILTLSPNSVLVGEDDTKYVFGTTGKISISLPLETPSNLNVANLGAVITSGANLGTTTIIRGHEVQKGNGMQSIERYYEINPVNNSALNATLEFRYMDHELNGQIEDKFVLYRSTDGGTTWTWGGGTVNPGANYVVLSGIESFSRWTVTNKDTNPLSRLEEVEAGQTHAFSIFPNPANLGAPITLGLLQIGEYWAEFIDAQGKLHAMTPISSSGLHELIELQLPIHTAGTYFLLIRDRQADQQIYGATSILIH